MSRVEHALAEAQTAEDVVIISFDESGEMSLHSTLTRGPDILWALELAKMQIIEMGQPEDA
ncbi:MAG: hypothetical protein EBR82_26990 [Caulobacteraceae bacterium]|nr:hypothetical protein [Caulobacteraceae bacterium]